MKTSSHTCDQMGPSIVIIIFQIVTNIKTVKRSTYLPIPKGFIFSKLGSGRVRRLDSVLRSRWEFYFRSLDHLLLSFLPLPLLCSTLINRYPQETSYMCDITFNTFKIHVKYTFRKESCVTLLFYPVSILFDIEPLRYVPYCYMGLFKTIHDLTFSS